MLSCRERGKTMSRNYPNPDSLATLAQLRAWGGPRETHEAVVAAIFAIADGKRPAVAIWENPTAAEWDHVGMAVEEYVRNGDFPAEGDGRYPWGQEAVHVGEQRFGIA
jgi:hypothetical protein